MKASDDEILGYDVDLEELGLTIKEKAGDVIAYMDHCEGRAVIIAKRAAELAAKATAFANKRKRLEAYVTFHMDKTDTKLLPGGDFGFVLSYSKAVDIKPGFHCNAAAALKYKGMVRRKASYDWDKVAIKKLLNANDAAAMKIASIKENPNLAIKPVT